ncbi:MAG: ArsR/SmtB family transcription factor [Solirubrobacteraceae bacterium]
MSSLSQVTNENPAPGHRSEAPGSEAGVRDAPVPEPLAHPGPEQFDLATVLHALSDPIRLRIVATLADGGERRCSSFALPVVKSTCTHHFRVLREAGVICQRLDGKTKLNSLRDVELEQRFPGLLAAVLRAAGA